MQKLTITKPKHMHTFKLQNFFGITLATFFLLSIPLQSQATTNNKHKTAESSRERLVLMPLRVPDDDKNLMGAMETALVKGLQQKYDVYSGEQVAQKAHEIFMKESRNTAHKECDETKCMQNIAMAFQAELIATANVTKQDGSYFLALSIQNIFDHKVVYSESLPCKNCDATQVVEKLKVLIGTDTPKAEVVSLEAPEAKQVQKAPTSHPNAPKGKYVFQGGLIWMPTKLGKTWSEADTYCTNTAINGQKGWRLPTKDELLALNNSGVMKDQWGKINSAWSSTPAGRDAHIYINLGDFPIGFNGVTGPPYVVNQINDDDSRSAMTCVHTQIVATEGNQKQQSESSKGKYVIRSGLTWTPITLEKNWSEADTYCTKTAINGQTGWRLPTEDELSALYNSGAMNGQGWTLGNTWSSSSVISGSHIYVSLNIGHTGAYYDKDPISLYVSCVR